MFPSSIKICTGLLLFALICAGFVKAPVKLTVVIKNVQAGKGSVVVALFNSSGSFLKKPVAQQIAKADKETLELSFTVPEGSYAAAIYQDVNDNRELDKNWLGIPKERYGFSNNFRPMFSAPDFDDCKFTVKGQTTTSISLK